MSITATRSLETSRTLNFYWESDDRLWEGVILFNQNPITRSSLATIWFSEIDEEKQLVPDGVLMRMDYDYQTNAFSRFWSKSCDCMRESFTNIVENSREKLAEWHQRALDHADKQLKHTLFDAELSHYAKRGAMVGYHEIVPGISKDKTQTTFTAGISMVHRNAHWLIFDMYCSEPKCQCSDQLLAFHSVEYEHGLPKAKNVAAIDYKLKNDYEIREIHDSAFTPGQADDLIKAWINHKPAWLTDDEIKSRSSQVKMVTARTWQKQAATAKELGLETGFSAPVMSRNSLCPCGSGKKYKRCCGTK